MRSLLKLIMRLYTVFMLDVERLDLSDIVYFDGQRFLEDYQLTLQLFTKENGDWDSLEREFLYRRLHSQR